MTRYNVYYQGFPLPTKVKDEHRANLVCVGQIWAANGEEAIQDARWEYKIRWPVVHELNEHGEEIWRQYDEISA